MQVQVWVQVQVQVQVWVQMGLQEQVQFHVLEFHNKMFKNINGLLVFTLVWPRCEGSIESN